MPHAATRIGPPNRAWIACDMHRDAGAGGAPAAAAEEGARPATRESDTMGGVGNLVGGPGEGPSRVDRGGRGGRRARSNRPTGRGGGRWGFVGQRWAAAASSSWRTMLLSAAVGATVTTSAHGIRELKTYFWSMVARVAKLGELGGAAAARGGVAGGAAAANYPPVSN